MSAPLEYINSIRTEEMERVVRSVAYFRGKELLELGSGTGRQLEFLQPMVRRIVGLELAGCSYVRKPELEIYEYDGQRIPFPDSSFDTVFSSHVIEHIRDEANIHAEIRRVLRQEGKAVHVVPTRAWRVTTSFVHYLAKLSSVIPSNGSNRRPEAVVGVKPGNLTSRIKNTLVPAQHGEFGNRFTEYWHFGVTQWKKRFLRNGWKIEATEPVGLAYTGNCLLAGRLSIDARSRLAKVFGSSSVVFVLGK